MSEISKFMMACLMITSVGCNKGNNRFKDTFPEELNRIWIGPYYWANPMQYWMVNNGRLECRVTAPDRSVHLITRMIDKGSNAHFQMETDMGFIDHENDQVNKSNMGCI